MCVCVCAMKVCVLCIDNTGEEGLEMLIHIRTTPCNTPTCLPQYLYKALCSFSSFILLFTLSLVLHRVQQE